MFVDAAEALLAWYDRHARTLPWRAPPGVAVADPYRVWLSEVMLQQTTVAAARAYFIRFTERWPTVESLAGEADETVMAAWAGLGYYARARNMLACARAVCAAGGHFPDTEAELLRLPGIGRYTAAAIAAIAFGRRAVVVDANVQRVVARLFAIDTPLPAARPLIHAAADSITPDARAGDFAQAMMDLGATICTSRSPVCVICPLRANCRAVRTGAPDRLPVKPPKRVRPRRRGTVFWIEQDDHVLLRHRPPKGLLGGMRALPSGPWQDEDPGIADAPLATGWTMLGRVEHVFTHFALDLTVVGGTAPDRAAAGEWWPIDRIGEAGLPTLFAKAATLASAMRPLPDIGDRPLTETPMPGFTGSRLDRLDHERDDPAALARHRADPHARLLLMNGLDPLADPAGALAWGTLADAPSDADLILLGLIDGTPRFAALTPIATDRGHNAIFRLLDSLPPGDAATYAVARSLIDWHARHGFCPRCGTPAGIIRAGWARRCPTCGDEHFPRTDPVVIMLAEHNGRVLVGRQPRFPAGRYSALAGFLEVGEALEEAVARELFEEAGVRATAVRYIASQPWPFPSSLMIACIAEVADDAITLDTKELEDAMWVSREDVIAALAGAPSARFLAPPSYAIAHTLFERWLAGA